MGLKYRPASERDPRELFDKEPKTEPKKQASTYTLHIDSNGEYGGTLNLNGAEIPLRPQEVINVLYKLGNARQVAEVEPGLFRYFY